jgi:hypothetical protein
MLLKIAGDLAGSAIAAAWTIAAVAGGPIRTLPTLHEAMAAQGIITWLLFFALALFGAAAWIARDTADLSSERSGSEVRRAVRALIRSAAWGFAVSMVGIYYEIHPLLVGFLVFITGIVADWLTETVTKMFVYVAANPVRAFRAWRIGRLALSGQIDDALREVEKETEKGDATTSDPLPRRGRWSGDN